MWSRGITNDIPVWNNILNLKQFLKQSNARFEKIWYFKKKKKKSYKNKEEHTFSNLGQTLHPQM